MRRDGSSNHTAIRSRLSNEPGDPSPERRGSPSSWPGEDEIRGRARERTRRQTGINTDRFGHQEEWPGRTVRSDNGGRDGRSGSSDPIRGASRLDPFHEAMGGRGPSIDSPFNKAYETYKDKDAAAEGAEENYKNYISNSKLPSKKQRAAAPPGTYAGQPLGTEAFHTTSGRYARTASGAYTEYVQPPRLITALHLRLRMILTRNSQCY